MSYLAGAAVIVATLAPAALPAQTWTVHGDAAAGAQKAEVCVPCHGPNGNSANPSVPSLAGQPPLYTYFQLIQFHQGRRVDAQMTPFATSLTDADMQDLAAYFATQLPAPSPAASDPAKAAAGQQVSAAHFCESCHVRGFVGQQQVPRLTGLSYEYLVRQLRGYKAQTRADTDGFMTMAAQPLSEADIENVAHYIASVAGATPRH